jgi:hypothetical protein
MAELVDASDSKSDFRKRVQVRFLFWAQDICTKIRREVVQPGRIPGLGPGGRRFESCPPDIQKTKVTTNVVAFVLS